MTLTRYSRRETFGLLLAAGVSGSSKLASGPAFHYEAVFSGDSERWYTRFPILVTGDILTQSQSDSLRVSGTKLVAYTWSSGFYPGDPSSAALGWQGIVQQHRATWLLNREPVGGAAAASGRVAEWYDFGNAELVSELARYLARRLISAGYDGFFFDTLGSEHVPAPLLKEFRVRHPGCDYDSAQGGLLAELRKQLPPGKLIFTNQGYRHAVAFLPWADLDLTESYFTALNGRGRTMIRRWSDPRAPWESVKVPMEQLVLAAARSYPGVRFVHLNYAAGDSATVRRAISYSHACAKLFEHEGYLVVPGTPRAECDEIYFSDLGRPAMRSYEEMADGAVVWREYERGVVAINSGSRAATIPGLGLKLADPPRGYVFGSYDKLEDRTHLRP